MITKDDDDLLGVTLIMTSGTTAIFGPEPPGIPLSRRRHPSCGHWVLCSVREPDRFLSSVPLVIGAIYLLMYRTRFGRGALGRWPHDRAVASAQGLHPARLFPMAFALATGLAGLTGALVTPILALDPHVGDSRSSPSHRHGRDPRRAGQHRRRDHRRLRRRRLRGLPRASISGGSKGALALFVFVLVILVVRPTGLMGRVARRA